MRAIYDFDKTIFDGDSTFRFCRFALSRQPLLLWGLPAVGWAFLLKALGLRTKTQAKEALYRKLLSGLRDVDGLIAQFWQENMSRIKPFYRAQKSPSDIVISASPEFLLAPACKALGVGTLIASQVDKRSGRYAGPNCDGEEKVRRYRAECAPEPFDFYSDSFIDTPMARLSRQAYLVTGERVEPWPADRL